MWLKHALLILLSWWDHPIVEYMGRIHISAKVHSCMSVSKLQVKPLHVRSQKSVCCVVAWPTTPPGAKSWSIAILPVLLTSPCSWHARSCAQCFRPTMNPFFFSILQRFTVCKVTELICLLSLCQLNFITTWLSLTLPDRMQSAGHLLEWLGYLESAPGNRLSEALRCSGVAVFGLHGQVSSWEC